MLNGELFLSLAEARFVLDEWRPDYNHRRPHYSLNWQTPAAFAATLTEDPATGAFPAASHADPPVGIRPTGFVLPTAQQATESSPLLSQRLD